MIKPYGAAFYDKQIERNWQFARHDFATETKTIQGCYILPRQFPGYVPTPDFLRSLATLKDHSLERIMISEFGCLHSLTFYFTGEVASPPERTYSERPLYSYWLARWVRVGKLEFGFHWRSQNKLNRMLTVLRLFNGQTGK